MRQNLEAFEKYLLLEKKYSLHTVKAYIDDIKTFQNFVLTTFEEATLEQINYNQIRTWIVTLVDKGLSSRSVNRKMSSLKAFYSFLMKIGQILEDPFIKHRALKTPKKIQIPFSEQEMTKVLSENIYTIDFEGVRNQLIIDLLYTTGIRRSELISLELQNVNLHQEILKIKGKRNKERLIPILPIIKKEIEKYLAERSNLEVIKDKDYFFLLKNGNKLNETFVYRLINDYFGLVSAKVKKSPHMIRHTFATHLLNNGATLNSVKELLGHSSLASTQVYTHNSVATLKKVYAKAHPRSLK